MPKIDDAELRHLFRIESAEHLQKLDAGLLSLEKTPHDQSLIQDIFRDAHSLKGSARMLGLLDIQSLANGVEDMLGEVRNGTLLITAEVIRPQLATLDKIRQLVAEAVEEPETPIQEKHESVTESVLLETNNENVAIEKERPKPEETQITQVVHQDFRIDTLRVDAKKLDFLLSQAGELVVSRNRILKWHEDFEVLINCFDQDRMTKEQLVEEVQLMRLKLLEDANRLSVITDEMEGGIRGLRLLPMLTLLEQFPRMVHDLAAAQNKQVELLFEGESTVADKRIIEEMKSPLMHMLRNAIDHGIEVAEVRLQAGKSPTGKILIKVSQEGNYVRLDLSDDGRGLDLNAIRQQSVKRNLFTEAQALALDDTQLKNVLMTPGFSTNKTVTEISGRGVGLDVVRAAVERMRGTIQMDSQPGKGMVFSLILPVSLTSTRVMILKEWGESYALPIEAIYFSKIIKPQDLLTREDRQCFYHGDEVITVCRLGELLGKPPQVQAPSTAFICVMIKLGTMNVGLLVDELQGEEEIVIKLLPIPIKRLRHVSGVTILDSGLVCAVLNALDLAKSINREHLSEISSPQSLPHSSILHKTIPYSTIPHASIPLITTPLKKSVLLVEDSIVTRVQEKRILETAGYDVTTAVDGTNAWNMLATRLFDAIVSDVMMPNMNGLELTTKIRANRKFSEIPIILVTSLASEEDRRRGLEAGADAYILKSDFDQSILLDSLSRLI